MANILEEYLVSVKYVVDAASENKMLEGIKKFAHSVLGINLEVLGLAAALTEMAKKIAEAGERWYWMSQRMGESSGELIAATNAMVALGMSAEQAVGALEGFRSWTQTMGPAATALLRGWGVTATDLKGQLLQLGPVLARMGGADPNNPNYWRVLQWERLMGISPDMGLRLARGDYARSQREQEQVQGSVWGGNWAKQIDQANEQAARFMETFSRFGFVFTELKRYFGAQLFPQLIPIFEHMFKLIQQYMPDIQAFLKAIASLVVHFFRLADAAATLFGALEHGIARLPYIFEVVLGLMAAFSAKMMLTPFGRWIAALSFLLLLVEDYIGWQHGLKSAFDWSGMDKAMKTKPEDRSWWQELLHIFGQIADYALLIGFVFRTLRLGTLIGLLRGGLGGLIGRLGLGRLLAGIGLRGLAGAAGTAAGGAAAMATGVGEVLIGAAIAALIYKAGEWLFSNPDVQKVMKEGAEGFWQFLKDTFSSQSEIDPTQGSVNQPQSLWGRITQGASGLGKAGDPTKEADMMNTLTSKYGLSREDAAAWISNWEAESGLRSDITYGGGGYNPDSTRAYGLMQWTGSRLKALREYAAMHHEDIRAMDTQLEFWWHELHNDPTYKNVLAHMAAARGRAKADIVFEESESGGAPSLEKYHEAHTGRYERILGLPSAPAVSGVGSKSPVVQNNNTNINLNPGPNAASTAAAVAGHQDQVNRESVRTLRQVAVR